MNFIVNVVIHTCFNQTNWVHTPIMTSAMKLISYINTYFPFHIFKKKQFKTNTIIKCKLNK